MKRALIIRHHEAETMGADFRAVLEGRGFRFAECNIFESAPAYDNFAPPPVGEVDLIMAFGGPMSVNDDLPGPAHRARVSAGGHDRGQACVRRLSGRADDVHRAGRHGGTQRRLPVRPAQAPGHRRGRTPIRFSGAIATPLAPTLHGECFTIPDGAVKLAEAHMLCRDGRYRRINMAFRYGPSYAFQFEPTAYP